MEHFKELRKESTNPLQNIAFTTLQEFNFFHLHLKIAYLSGLIYFIMGFLEFAGDWSRYYEDNFIFGAYGYIAIKLIALICYTLFMRGFHIVGSLCNKYLLKFSSVLLIILGVVFYGYDIISIYYARLDVEYVLISSSIFYGIAGMIFGYALLKLEEYFGVLALQRVDLPLLPPFS